MMKFNNSKFFYISFGNYKVEAYNYNFHETCGSKFDSAKDLRVSIDDDSTFQNHIEYVNAK